MGWRDELQWRKFGWKLEPTELQRFSRSSFCSQAVFAGWRFAAAAYLLAVLIWALIDYDGDGDLAYFYIYLTHWTLLIQVVYLCCAAILTIRAVPRNAVGASNGASQAAPERPKAFALFTWFLQDLTYDASFAVVLLFWGLIAGNFRSPLTYQVHGSNFLLTLIDCFVTAHPVRLLHFWVVQLYGLAYVLWTFINYAVDVGDGTGNPYIYSVLDWSNPGSAAATSAVVLLVVLPVLHVLLYAWRQLGQACADRWVWRKYGSSDSSEAHPALGAPFIAADVP